MKTKELGIWVVVGCLLSLKAESSVSHHPISSIKNTEIVVCSSEFNAYLGAWKGRIETLNSEFSVPMESEITFSQRSCQKNQNGNLITLLGKQTLLIPASRHSSERIIHRLIELGPKSLLFRNSDNTVDEFVLTRGRVGESSLLWSQVHGPQTMEWQILNEGGNRYLKWIQSDTTKNTSASGRFQELWDGHHSRAVGQAWVFTPDGRMGETNEFLTEKVYSPARGALKETAWVYKRDSSKMNEAREFDLSYRVLEDRPDALSGGIRLSENIDSSFKLYEVFQGTTMYSELRHVDKNGIEKTVLIQKADELQETDFETRLRSILSQRSPKTMLR